MKLSDFEEIYNNTYDYVLKFIVIKCNDIDNVKDIIQDTYVELYNKLKKKNIDIDDNTSYIIGIAKNIIKRHYYKSKFNELSIDDNNIEINSSIDIEQSFITQENAEKVWNYIKAKDFTTAKIFYLYFILEHKIEEISKELQINESTTKSRIYRTLKEIQNKLGEEV